MDHLPVAGIDPDVRDVPRGPEGEEVARKQL